jgi:hypothetical protein
MNMLATIVPKSDQLNSDDLIGRTMTITVTDVSIAMAEQPVSISFEGDNGKPFRPGKSMRRVLVKVWGADAKVYVGRSMTLYRDDGVKFGGLAVGGIRVSHMSHLDKPMTMALTETRGNKKPFTVKPLVIEAPIAEKPKLTPMESFTAKIASLTTREQCFALLNPGTKAKDVYDKQPDADREAISALLAARADELTPSAPEPSDDVFPGDA